MLRILYASHTPALQGASVSLAQLVLGLDREAFQPTVVFSKGGALVEQLLARGIQARTLLRKGWLGRRLIMDALRVMDERQVQLVHLNCAVPFCKYIGIAARLRKLPVLWHIREDPSGSRVQRLRKWIRRLSDRILVVSSELETAFREEGRVVKIYNGVSTRDFNPRVEGRSLRERYGIPYGAFVFGIVGTIEERKGVLAFLEAAHEMLREGADAYFLVVGGGLEDAERTVRDYVQSHEILRSRARLTGRLSAIPEVMAALDILVLPSLWEGFPRSLIEAMASGKPAIATDVGEVPWMIEDGRTGFLIPRGQQESLVRAMRGALGQRSALKEMGLAARAKAEAEYSIERHVREVCRQYGELVPG